ncbi:hypothetical protein JQS43_00225 [Natronosporangium hydrolyticum]|uniref:Uncharacterized protein n=1 Tax=Natronosporangium hydrolyticum TaxID=2811111 RepID=A0A895YHL1_9ACTN|nr:hypothetical protein [Natronosporangium hydrolyticum]QSB14863.1 hypothetical protein JQS43_00225 [Natronosporangium hydrolyticum]
MKIAVPAAAGALVVLTGCADPDGDEPAGVSPDEQLYETVATVLESPEHGPQLCHAVAHSLPPQCSGPDVVGWDWDAVTSESAEGVTWGDYYLVGSWDGESFHLAESARAPEPEELAQFFDTDEPRFDTPCEEPAGGWEPDDPETTTDETLNEALELARNDPEYAGSWVDQSVADDADTDELGLGNDPTELVLNVQFTEDLPEKEQELRTVWGGALCVTGAAHTEQELLSVQEQLHEDLPEINSSRVDTMTNALIAEVFVVTPELQAELDEQYGPGTVVLEGLLQPR